MSENIKVVVRVRPFLDNEGRRSSCLTVTGNQVMVGESRCFAFDEILGMKSTGDDVYAAVGQPLADAFLNGFNVSMIAYGQTGSGKTFTMASLSEDVIEEVFMRLQEIKEGDVAANNAHTSASFRVTALEVYNEHVGDLLAGEVAASAAAGRHGSVAITTTTNNGSAPAGALQVREDPKGGVHVPGLTELTVSTKAELLSVVESATANRKTASTLMNSTSSRSHCIVTVAMKHKGVTSKCCFIDLAGSERLKKSLGLGGPDMPSLVKSMDYSEDVVMERMREGISINSGLLALGNVIVALCEKKAHVPYRSSKLTRLLQPMLGGNSKTSMVACVSPVSSSLEESLNTLKYADRAKSIRTNPHLVVSTFSDTEEAERTILALREELALAQQQLAAATAAAPTRSRSAGGGGPPKVPPRRTASPGSPTPLASVVASHSSLPAELAELQAALAREQKLTRRLQDDLFTAEYTTMVEVEKRKALEERLADLDETSTAASGVSDDSPRTRLTVSSALLQKLEGERLSLEEQRSQKEADKLRIRAALDTADCLAVGLEDSVSGLSLEIEEKTRRIDILKKENAEATRQLGEYEHELAKASDVKRKLTEDLAKAEALLEASEMARQKREEEKAKLRASFRERMKTAEERIADYRRRVSQAEQEIRRRTLSIQQVEQLKAQVERLKEEVSKHKSTARAERSKVNRLTSVHGQEMVKLQHSLKETEHHVTKLQVSLRKKDEEIARALAQLDAASHQYSGTTVSRGSQVLVNAHEPMHTRLSNHLSGGTSTSLAASKSHKRVVVKRCSSSSSAGVSTGKLSTPPPSVPSLSPAEEDTNTSVQAEIDRELETLEDLEKELGELQSYRDMLAQTRTSDAPKWKKAVQGFTKRLQAIDGQLRGFTGQESARIALETERDDIERKLRQLDSFQSMFDEASTQLEEFENRIDSLNEARKFHLHRVRRLQNPSQGGGGEGAWPPTVAEYGLPSVRDIASTRLKRFGNSKRTRKPCGSGTGGGSSDRSGAAAARRGAGSGRAGVDEQYVTELEAAMSRLLAESDAMKREIALLKAR